MSYLGLQPPRTVVFTASNGTAEPAAVCALLLPSPRALRQLTVDISFIQYKQGRYIFNQINLKTLIRCSRVDEVQCSLRSE